VAKSPSVLKIAAGKAELLKPLVGGKPGPKAKAVLKRMSGDKVPADQSPDRVPEDWRRPPGSWGLGSKKPHADKTPVMKRKRAVRAPLYGPHEATWGEPWAMSTQQDRALQRRQQARKAHRPGTGSA
jgi:hypothetical protein